MAHTSAYNSGAKCKHSDVSDSEYGLETNNYEINLQQQQQKILTSHLSKESNGLKASELSDQLTVMQQQA